MEGLADRLVCPGDCSAVFGIEVYQGGSYERG